MTGTPHGARSERPNSIPWPPLLYVGAIGLGLLAETVLATPAGAVPSALHIIGAALLAAGALSDVAAMITMARASANILPHRAATRLVTHGPFRWSRNPIYLGNTVMTIGAAFAFGKLWLLASAVAAASATHHLAILREEAHLHAKFGETWRRYAAATPRWLGPV